MVQVKLAKLLSHMLLLLILLTFMQKLSGDSRNSLAGHEITFCVVTLFVGGEHFTVQAVLHSETNNHENEVSNHVSSHPMLNHTSSSSAPSSNHSKDADVDRSRHRSNTNTDEVE